MAKNPGYRYQSGSEMACDIKDLREWGGLVRDSPALPDPLGATTFIYSAAHAVSMATRASRTSLPQRRTFEQWLTARTCIFATVALLVIMSASAYLGSRSTPNPLAEAAQTPVPLAHAPAPSSAVVVRLPAPHPHAVPGLNSAKQGAMAKLAHIVPQATVGMAELQIEIDDPFADAKASVWLDNRLVYSTSIRGEATKHALLFRHVAGHESRTVHYPAGEHQVHVRVESTANGFDQSRTIAAKLAAGQETTLHVTCDKRADDLQVALQPAAPSHSLRFKS
jgi:hypothetical protein